MARRNQMPCLFCNYLIIDLNTDRMARRKMCGREKEERKFVFDWPYLFFQIDFNCVYKRITQLLGMYTRVKIVRFVASAFYSITIAAFCLRTHDAQIRSISLIFYMVVCFYFHLVCRCVCVC